MIAQRAVAEIERAIADLKGRWPAHSVPAAMMAQLDDLEDELAVARAREASDA